jgi:hypothetical protein
MSKIKVNEISKHDSSEITINDTIKVDTISEKTSTAGVTIDSVLLKDGQVDGVDVSALNTTVGNINSGLTLIKNQSYSEVSTSGTDFDNVFTTTYDNYLLQVNDIQYFTAGEYLRFRFRTGGASGSDATLSTYRYAWEYQSLNNDATGDRGATGSQSADYGWIHWWTGGAVGTSYVGWAECKFRNPNKAANTFQKQESVEYYNSSSEWRRVDAEYMFPENTQFTGIRLETSGGNNFTANVRLYGYNL